MSSRVEDKRIQRSRLKSSKHTLVLSDRMIQVIAMRFRMLGEPMRLRILQVLESGEQMVSQIVARTGGTQSNVSRHLLALYRTGIVGRRQVGNTALYSVADPMVMKICRMVCRAAAEDANSKSAPLHTKQSARR